MLFWENWITWRSYKVVPKALTVKAYEDAITCPAPESEDIKMDENDQFQDENVPNDDVYIDDEKNRMNMITSWGFEKYLLFMIMDGTKVPFNGIIQK